MREHVQVIVKDSNPESGSQTYGVLDNGRQWRVNDGYTKKAIILEGMGWGSMPEHLIEEELKSKKLVPLTIKNFPTTIKIETRVARLSDRPRGPIADCLWTQLKNSFQRQEI